MPPTYPILIQSTPEPPMKTSDIEALAAQIRCAELGSLQTNLQAGAWIRTINRLPGGSEALRLIVRDNICNAGNAVADALWMGL